MGVPTVTIVTDQFVTLARGTQKSQGLTDMCFVTVPHPIGMLPKEQVDAKVDAAFGDIVKAATQWQPVKEKEAAQESPYPAKTFKFTGTYADVNKLFAKRKWSLSLPIIPPTVDRVREMLKGTKHAPPGYADCRACGRPRRHGRGPARAHAPAARHDRRHEGP